MLATLAPRLLPLTILAMLAMLCARSLDLARGFLPAAASGAAQAAEPTAQDVPKPAKAADAAPAKAAEAAPAKPGEAAQAKPGEATPAKAAKPAETSAAPTPPQPDQPISESERALLLDLRKRRLELDQRDAALAAREGVLAAAQTRLTARLDELRDLQKRLELLEAARTAHDEANWRGLVKLYESMKPKDAANIFNDLEPSVLLPVLDRMKEAKAAPILAAMLPDRARAATADLARMRAQGNAVPNAAPTTPPTTMANGGPNPPPPGGAAKSPPTN